MSVHSWTSIRRILGDIEDIIPKDLFNEAECLEWASIALGKVGGYPALEEDVKFAFVSEFQAPLPKGLLQINQIAYKADTALLQQDIDELKALLTARDKDQSEAIDAVNTKLLSRIIASSNFVKNGFKPLRLNTSSFGRALHASDCTNLYSDCKESYSIRPNGSILTTFKTGCLYISYVRYPLDKFGDFLVPDNEDLLDALKTYCLMKVWEKRWNMKEEGSSERFQYYGSTWEGLMAKARASIILPSIDELENIRTMRNRLIPVERRYNTFFGNLGTEENISTKGFYAKSQESNSLSPLFIN